MMVFHNAIDRGQPQSSTASNLFGRKKGLENTFDGTFIHAHARIGDLDLDIGSGEQVVPLIFQLLGHGPAGEDGQVTAVGHGIYGVNEKVEQCDFYLALVGIQNGWIGIEMTMDAKVLIGTLDHVQGVFDQPVNIH